MKTDAAQNVGYFSVTPHHTLLGALCVSNSFPVVFPVSASTAEMVKSTTDPELSINKT